MFDNRKVIGDFQAEVLKAVLKLQKPYGVQIRDFLSQELNRDVHLPQVYSALLKMEASGLLSSQFEKAKSAGRNTRGRPRRIYSINAPGLRMLNARHDYLLEVHHIGDADGVPREVATT